MESYIAFVRRIYSYCDENVGKEFLFTELVFLHSKELYQNGSSVTKKDLVASISKAVNRLLEKRVLEDVSNIFDLYGKYKILPHKNLIEKSLNSN